MMSYTLQDFYFDLPESQIAQRPLPQRDASRLMVFNKNDGSIFHSKFKDLSSFLTETDILVLNNTRVIEARIPCKRESGGKVELLLIHKIDSQHWKCITNRTSRLKTDDKILTENEEITFTVLAKEEMVFSVKSDKDITDEILKKIGSIPLPPYIKRNADIVDSERYQTVYAEHGTSVAAPTAGLHFTEALLHDLNNKGIEILHVNLSVSWGTFQPVRDEILQNHKMHSEWYSISDETADRLNTGKKKGQRFIAVGTTSLRVLESAFHNNKYYGGEGSTNIFIYPPYNVKSIDSLITNFHTPYSTLLMLVCAYGGYDNIMKAYKTAVVEKYRFFSYGDSMFITGEQ